MACVRVVYKITSTRLVSVFVAARLLWTPRQRQIYGDLHAKLVDETLAELMQDALTGPDPVAIEATTRLGKASMRAIVQAHATDVVITIMSVSFGGDGGGGGGGSWFDSLAYEDHVVAMKATLSPDGNCWRFDQTHGEPVWPIWQPETPDAIAREPDYMFIRARMLAIGSAGDGYREQDGYLSNDIYTSTLNPVPAGVCAGESRIIKTNWPLIETDTFSEAISSAQTTACDSCRADPSAGGVFFVALAGETSQLQRASRHCIRDTGGGRVRDPALSSDGTTYFVARDEGGSIDHRPEKGRPKFSEMIGVGRSDARPSYMKRLQWPIGTGIDV